MPLRIREVILENFMSYEYGRVPFKPGLNLICGPNGAGKSTILVAMSVAMGQSYTERSRKLADLIRRGRDVARVTIVLDNSRDHRGRRPISSIPRDIVTVSRYLKKDGTYWFEINNREVSKAEVARLFRMVGINPDNMLVIMHQNMIEQFAVLPPKEKLLLLEEAVGFAGYRRNIYEAKAKLGATLAEEEAIQRDLERARQTLAFWKEKYEKYLQKRELMERRALLERELIWAQVLRKEEEAAELEEKIERKQSMIEELTKLIEEKAREAEGALSKYRGARERVHATFISYAERRDPALLDEVAVIEKEVDTYFNQYVDTKVQEAISRFRRSLMEKELKELQRKLREARKELEELYIKAEEAQPRVETKRTPAEVQEELRFVNLQLSTLADIPDDVEAIYKRYEQSLKELEERAQIAAENKRRALQELESRIKVWRSKLEELIEKVNPVYQHILERVGGIGAIRLVNREDPEKAGLEILVGFRGNIPVVLDAYSQSGGERSVATMAFLLALQHYLKSPIRAVDEFDVHMDPSNREAMMNMVLSFTKENKDVQFIVITPSQLAVKEMQDVNIILVQNVRGSSEVATVEEETA